MSEAHTEGPWKAKLHGTMPDGVSMYWLAEGVSLGTSNPADARLIAAAPELLDALEIATNAAEVFQEGGDIAAIMEFDAWVEKARAAIAKARGGAS
jgi:predicted RNA-binding protein Jag